MHKRAREGAVTAVPDAALMRWLLLQGGTSPTRPQANQTTAAGPHRVMTLNQPPLEGNPADGCGSGKNVCHPLLLTPLVPAAPLEAGRSRYLCCNLLCTSGGQVASSRSAEVYSRASRKACLFLVQSAAGLESPLPSSWLVSY